MLVISRKVGESVELSGPGKVVFQGFRGGRARWKIIAPKTTKVLRSELCGREPKDQRQEGRIDA